MDQEFIDQLAEKLSKLGSKRPLGFHYAHPFGKVPADSIQCNGATYNRALYADFFAYASEQGWVKTESEWQSIASSNGGYCPWYSDGDGSTNFRTPKFAPFMQIAIASSSVGTHHQAGLPNITSFNTDSTQIGGWSHSNENLKNGALSTTRLENWGPRSQSSYRDGYHHMISLDASRSSSVYGASDTVQPESHEWMICVVVLGIATNVGSADISEVMSAVAQVQADVGAIPKPNTYITQTWKSGSSWYRVWSDGFIEQGGRVENSGTIMTITLLKPFGGTDYFALCVPYSPTGTAYNSMIGCGKKTTQSFVFRMVTADGSANSSTYRDWIAYGY